ncbi:MAG: metal ABC transporter permease [Clostridia bacterium]|nr:metal ABC transporter permease [Clostridia bacterium]
MIMEFLSHPFIVRAIVCGGLICLCAALLGVTLVLKRFSMIGDGLSHVGFGALSLALALNAAPLPVAAPIVAASAFLLLKLSENSRIKGDAAIAIISTSALAFGVIVTSLSGGTNADISSLMFGSILAMNKADVYISACLAVIVITVFVLFYNKLFAVTFDESFSKAAGVNVSAFNSLIALLTAVTVVIGMRIMGTLLISSIIIFPALTSMRVFKHFRSVVISSAVVSVVCFIFGIFLSFVFEIPAGAAVVAANLLAFALFSLKPLIVK